MCYNLKVNLDWSKKMNKLLQMLREEQKVELENLNINELRALGKNICLSSPTVLDKDELIEDEESVINAYILLPNVWNTITYENARFYEEMYLEGKTLFIVDPEFFDIHEIGDPFDLYDYIMTPLQEQMI